MLKFTLILLAMFLGDFAWWALTDKLARRLPRPKPWRRFAAVAVGLPAFGMLLLMAARVLHLHVMVEPETAVMYVFMWHFLVLPASLIPLAIAWAGRRGYRAWRPQPVSASRRAFLGRTVMVLPPLAAVALTGQCVSSEDDLRLRELDVPVPNLPPALEGLVIAQVTDPHLGSFITDTKIRKIIDMTNGIDADLVLQTGDLINSSLGDLPDGIEMCRKLRGRYGVYHCEGNHDTFEDRGTFEGDTVKAGLNMLLDETRTITVRGQRVCLAAPRWYGYKDQDIAASVNGLVPMLAPGAFPLLMVHHPHGFDAAAAAGIPLTLSGHTHGGQIALSQNVGVGPLMYRYWSGPLPQTDRHLRRQQRHGQLVPAADQRAVRDPEANPASGVNGDGRKSPKTGPICSCHFANALGEDGLGRAST